MVLLPVEDPWRREAVRHPGEHSAQRVPRGPAAGARGRHQQLRHHHPERPQGRKRQFADLSIKFKPYSYP